MHIETRGGIDESIGKIHMQAATAFTTLEKVAKFSSMKWLMGIAKSCSIAAAKLIRAVVSAVSNLVVEAA